MSYYTGQIFEISYKDHPSSIAGGGRYDRMIGRILGRDVPACGFSIGFERIVAILQEQGGAVVEPARRLALIFDGERDDLAEVVAVGATPPCRGASRLPRSRGASDSASSWTTSPPTASAST